MQQRNKGQQSGAKKETKRDTHLIDRNVSSILLPEHLRVDDRVLAARRSLHHHDPARSILPRHARLHHRRSLGRSVLLDLAVDESVEEVVQRVLLEIG
jgi:hypothetical protein